MEGAPGRVVSRSNEVGSTEERMLEAELLREMVARKEQAEGVKRIARELAVDRKTVKHWLRLGGCGNRGQLSGVPGNWTASPSFSSGGHRKSALTAQCCTGKLRNLRRVEPHFRK